MLCEQILSSADERFNSTKPHSDSTKDHILRVLEDPSHWLNNLPKSKISTRVDTKPLYTALYILNDEPIDSVLIMPITAKSHPRYFNKSEKQTYRVAIFYRNTTVTNMGIKPIWVSHHLFSCNIEEVVDLCERIITEANLSTPDICNDGVYKIVWFKMKPYTKHKTILKQISKKKVYDIHHDARMRTPVSIKLLTDELHQSPVLAVVSLYTYNREIIMEGNIDGLTDGIVGLKVGVGKLGSITILPDTIYIDNSGVILKEFE